MREKRHRDPHGSPQKFPTPSAHKQPISSKNGRKFLLP